MAAPSLRVVESLAVSYRRTWRFGAVTSFVMPVLFLLAMGLGLGDLVDHGPGADRGALAGVSYLAFIAPGLMAATAMQVAAGESTFPILARVKWNPTYPAMLATPVGVQDLVTGQLLWIGLRLLQSSVVFLVVMAGFGTLESPWALLAVPVATLTGLAVAIPICAFSASVEQDIHLATLLRFAIVPMFLFSGTFFPVTRLPVALRAVAYLTPLWHGVDLCRDLTLGQPGMGRSAAHVGYLLLWMAAGVPLALLSFRRRLVL